MTIDQADLTSCDTEPIHMIGTIQPAGALVAADSETLVVTHASENLVEYLGQPAEHALDRSLDELIGSTLCQELLERPLDPLGPDLLRPWFPQLQNQPIDTGQLEILPHRYAGHVVLEVSKLADNRSEVWQQDALRQRIISDLTKPDTLEDLANVSADIIRQITDFDRVMIYRFAEDKHGQVIAESTNRPDSYLDMHYPASDIPDPARRHFTLNLIRAIPDIKASPCAILTRRGETADAASATPLDLTFSKLRGVAPVHIEYLSNMGVGASMSISLVSNDELWGLVACHHYSPHHLPSSILRFCEMLGSTISALLQNLENTALLRRSIAAERAAYDIEAVARKKPDLRGLIGDHADDLLELTASQGIILHIDGETSCFGSVPENLVDFASLSSSIDDGIAVTNHLGSVLDLQPSQIAQASGAAFLELSENDEDHLILLREQFEHVVKWAGKPEKVETIGSNGVRRLSPRGSFALWRQERFGRSKPFTTIDREVLRILRRALFALNSLNRERAAVLAQRQAETDTHKMRMTLMEAARKSSMGELAGALAHELNQPLAAISNYVSACRQELYNCGVAIPDNVLQHIDEAVEEASRAANLVRRLRSFISTGQLLRETGSLNTVARQAAELAIISEENECLAELRFDFDDDLPKFAFDLVQVGQVVLNLVRNSIDALDGEPGNIIVSTRRFKNWVEAAVRDTGPGIEEETMATLFEPFHSSTTEGMGMGLSLCRSIVEAHSGKIWNVAGESGAEIRFSLPVEFET